jgi:hypothetical protein
MGRTAASVQETSGGLRTAALARDRVAHGEPGGAGAERDDPARRLAAHHGGQDDGGRPGRATARTAFPVDRVDARRAHGDQQVTGARSRSRKVGEVLDLRSAETVVHEGQGHTAPRRLCPGFGH